MLNGTKTVIKQKIGLLNLAEALGNVSKACRIMGLSRDTFYRYRNAVEQGGVDALVDRKRRKPNKKAGRQQIRLLSFLYCVDAP